MVKTLFPMERAHIPPLVEFTACHSGLGKKKKKKAAKVLCQPVHPKGNQSGIFIGRTDVEAETPVPSDAKNQLIGKDPDAGKD